LARQGTGGALRCGRLRARSVSGPSRGLGPEYGDELEAAQPDEEVPGEPVTEQPVDPQSHELIVAEMVRSFQGPVPSPEDLAQYERALPGCADRLISLTERQSAHRQSMQRHMVQSDTSLRARGQVFAFVIAMTAIIGSIVLIAVDKDIAGFVTLIGTLGTLLSVFVYTQVRRSRKDQSVEEAQPEPGRELERQDQASRRASATGPRSGCIRGRTRRPLPEATPGGCSAGGLLPRVWGAGAGRHGELSSCSSFTLGTTSWND
jgi:uncharacterized membrane protein